MFLRGLATIGIEHSWYYQRSFPQCVDKTPHTPRSRAFGLMPNAFALVVQNSVITFNNITKKL